MIFSILSLLRRGSANVVYVTDPSLIKGERKCLWVNFDNKKLEESLEPKFYKLESKQSSKIAAAEICQMENAIYTSLLEGKIYTLFLGPEIGSENYRGTHLAVCIGMQGTIPSL